MASDIEGFNERYLHERLTSVKALPGEVILQSRRVIPSRMSSVDEKERTF